MRHSNCSSSVTYVVFPITCQGALENKTHETKKHLIRGRIGDDVTSLGTSGQKLFQNVALTFPVCFCVMCYACKQISLIIFLNDPRKFLHPYLSMDIQITSLKTRLDVAWCQFLSYRISTAITLTTCRQLAKKTDNKGIT